MDLMSYTAHTSPPAPDRTKARRARQVAQRLRSVGPLDLEALKRACDAHQMEAA